MKKLALIALLPALALSACGSVPGQTSGNRVSMGVYASDAGSSVDVTRTYTPETVDDKGKVTPASITWSQGPAGTVDFTFMTRPGSDAVYITGWKITRYDFNGRVITDMGDLKKIDIYVPSGYTCPEREAGNLASHQSCQIYATNMKLRPEVQAANGLPTPPLKLNFAGALAGEVQRTLQSAYSTVDIEFTGYSSNNDPVVVKADNITSRAHKLGN